MVAGQLDEIGIAPAQIMLEPMARGTAPAIAAAARLVEQAEGGDAVIAVFPADHLIADQAAFQNALHDAVALAKAGHLVTFGVVPTNPNTGYGYLHAPGQPESSGISIDQFVEKPDQEQAAEYLARGGYFWNSGMFVFRVDALIQEFSKHAPEILDACTQAVKKAEADGPFIRLGHDDFSSAPEDSIDYAVMESTTSAKMVPLNAGWSDVGSWNALWQASEKDAHNNAFEGDVLSEDTLDSLIISQRGLVATLGVSNLVIVDTADAVLVADRGKSDELKTLVKKISAAKRSEVSLHRRVYRPWGSYDSLDQGPGFQVKRIFVDPGKQLSLQRHQHRAEHWVVIRGTARVTVGETVTDLKPNQSTYIAAGEAHRLANFGAAPLEIIEVQTGDYLGEDDIERLEDDFNRSGG